MKRQFLSIWAGAVIASALTACQRPELPLRGGDSDELVQFHAICNVDAWDGFAPAQEGHQQEGTKGMVSSIYDGVIHNINALVFSYGPSGLEFEPNRSRYFEGTPVHLLMDGHMSYKVYFLANCGDKVLKQACELGDCESIMQNLRVEYNDFVNNVQNSGLPMICETQIRPGGSSSDILLLFRRLYSRIALRLDCSELKYSSYTVKSLKLVNAPKAIYPLAGPSKIRDATDACTTSEADVASRIDISLLNKNGIAYFYVLENAQGELLPGNDDCTAKAPWNLIQNGHGDLLDKNCLTSIHMQVSADTPWAKYDNVTMQAYLGQNATSDFSIIGNTAHVLTLKLSADQVIRSEWRIEPDKPTKEYNPHMELKLETYTDENRIWQPRISLKCFDCEKIDQLAGSFLEDIKVKLSITSRHYMNTQFRVLSSWQYMNKGLVENGGKFTSTPRFNESQTFSNGSFREGYYTGTFFFAPPNYVRECRTYDEKQPDGCIFLPGKNDTRQYEDNFHAAIDPGIQRSYILFNEYSEYDRAYNRWIWDYYSESYLTAQNEVGVVLNVSFPQEMNDFIETVYGKTLQGFVDFSADFHGGCPYSEKSLEKLGLKDARIQYSVH